MRKTKEEILREQASYRGMVITPAAITAMQTYADQEAVGFAEWKDINCTESPYMRGYYHYNNVLYTTHQLYAIYKENKF